MYNNIVKSKMKYSIVMSNSYTEESQVIAKFEKLGDCNRFLSTLIRDTKEVSNITFDLHIGPLKQQTP